MAKRRKEELIFDSDGAVDVEAMREDRGEQPTEFIAPDKDQKWRARNVITIHWLLTGIECPYPSFVHIMACVIDHANPTTGRCDASQSLMAIETGFHRDTVRKVLQWTADNTPFLKIEGRGRRRFGQFRTNAYHVQWQAFELFWIGLDEDIKAQKEALRDGEPCQLKGQHGHAKSRVSTAMLNAGLSTKHKEGTVKTEHHPERAHPPSAADAMNDSQEEKEGLQGVHVAEPVRPSEAEREAQIAEIEKRIGRKFGDRRRSE